MAGQWDDEHGLLVVPLGRYAPGYRRRAQVLPVHCPEPPPQPWERVWVGRHDGLSQPSVAVYGETALPFW